MSKNVEELNDGTNNISFLLLVRGVSISRFRMFSIAKVSSGSFSTRVLNLQVNFITQHGEASVRVEDVVTRSSFVGLISL